MDRIAFRFFFIYFLLTIAPWNWFEQIPGISYLLELLFVHIEQPVVELFNKYLLHISATLNIDGGGSGDTSYFWAQFYTYVIVSLAGCVVWTLVDRRRQKNYGTLDYGLSLLLRVHLIRVSFSYGIIKVFALQMPFPNLSQLTTPLGDFLPMRLSWMFIGYSSPYQAFSGVMEIIVAILLLSRKTTTTGALLGVAVFANVFALNLSYDIPVKLFSMQMVICCLFLAARDRERIINFLFRNKTAGPSRTYGVTFPKKWQRVFSVVSRSAVAVFFVLIPFYETWNWYKENSKDGEQLPTGIGIYDIETFINGTDTLHTAINGKFEWKDFIFDRQGIGSVNTLDTLFRQRYRRGYFVYEPDTVNKVVRFKKFASATDVLFEMRYSILDKDVIEMQGNVNKELLYFKLRRNNRHFQLTEKQFHWISESNR